MERTLNLRLTVFNRKVKLKIVALSLPLLLALVFFNACTGNEDFANPLDPENLRTSGAPDGLTLYAGDQQVRITWNDTGQAGIKAYRIYRRSTGGADTEFQQVGSVDAPANEFIDTQNLENDRRDASGRLLAYEYRISYVDANGVETPDPANPPTENEDPRRIWRTALATPSVPPPAPNVTLGDPTDLTIKLFWMAMNSLTTFLSSVSIARWIPKMTSRSVSSLLRNRNEIGSTISTMISKSMVLERSIASPVLTNSAQRQSRRLLRQSQMYRLHLQKTFGSVIWHVLFLIQNTMRFSHGHRTPNLIWLGINSILEMPLETPPSPCGRPQGAHFHYPW